MNLEHEKEQQEILGRIMLNNSYLDTFVELGLHPQSFSNVKARMIFSAMLQIKMKNEPIDLVTTVETLKRFGRFESVGTKYLCECFEFEEGSNGKGIDDNYNKGI